jgi:hypothetical protein
VPEHLLDLGDDVVHVEQRRLEHLPAAELEQLADDVGGALGRDPHLEQLAVRVLRQILRSQQHVGVPADHREQIVEVVRDAAGELADRLDSRRLLELRLEQLALGRVGLEADVRHDLALGVAERARPECNRDRRAVAALGGHLGARWVRAAGELLVEVADGSAQSSGGTVGSTRSSGTNGRSASTLSPTRRTT